MLSNVLHCIIGGFEHSGTTLLTDLLRQHPMLDSGFEGGFLLKECPADFFGFEPFYGNMKRTWNLNDAAMRNICNAATFEAAYGRLRDLSPVIANKLCKIFDKTPRYMRHMTEILLRHRDVPAIIMVRDPRSVMWSSFKRVKAKQPGIDVEAWMRDIYPATLTHTLGYAEAAIRAKKAHPRRVLIVKYEDLCLNAEVVARSIFSHIKLEFDLKFLSFDPKYNLTYGHSIDGKYIDEYRKGFTDGQIQRFSQDYAWFIKALA